MNLLQFCAFFLITLCSTNAANILGLMMLPSSSHHIWNRSLMLALAAKGHNITVLSSKAEKDSIPNYKEYVVSEVFRYATDTSELADNTPFSFVDVLFDYSTYSCIQTLSAKNTMELLKLTNSTTFDLIIADVTAVDCVLGFVHVFKSPPLVAVTAYSHPLWVSYMTGNPHNPSYVPELSTSFSDRMSFYQRLYNTMVHLYSRYKTKYSYMPEVNRMVREYFGQNVPSVEDIRNNASLVLVNTDISFDYRRPLVPAIVEVGGMHIGPNKSLPKHLKKPMDEATEGFIYFSLGTFLRCDEIPADRRQVFLDAFSKLPYKIFWKWESDSLPGQPSNVILGKWMPQRDILAHPNILLFITHNGLHSTQESIYNGVPMVGVPFFADQDINSAKAIAHGLAERVDYKTMTADQLLTTIKKVINDPRYRKNAERLSKLMKDQPQTPLERAIFWVEYVIRHKGAPHLRSAAADMPWYQYLLLDVVCVLGAGVLLVLLLLYKSVLTVVAFVTRSSWTVKLKKH